MPNKPLAKIYHFDSFGKRQEKYDRLNDTEFKDVNWKELDVKEPYYFFVPKDFGAEVKYNQGFSVSEIFKNHSMGIATGKDDELVSYKRESLVEKFGEENITNFYYKPFDIRYTIFDNNILQRARFKFMSNYFYKDNIGFNCVRQSKGKGTEILASRIISNRDLITNHTYSFPLYLYNQKNPSASLPLGEIEGGQKTPNFTPEIIKKIEKKLGMKLCSEQGGATPCSTKDMIFFTPENLFDYIYSVLHSKTYRETYKEFLKIDFPKIPFDIDKDTFFKMVKLGSELRSYHLLENENLTPKNFITKYEIDGDNLVEKVKYENNMNKGLQPLVQNNGNIFINDTQYFSGVPENVLDFFIGGYQPAQKWLKDRKGRNLNYEDILHYSKIILCLKETIRIMEEIDNIYKI